VKPVDNAIHAGDALYQAWLAADAEAGPQRAYRQACRLRDPLRQLGRVGAARADWALAHTLFWMGRFDEALTLLSALRLDAIDPQVDAGFRHIGLELLIPAQLSWTLALLGDKRAALAHAESLKVGENIATPTRLIAYASHALSLLHCFLDRPETCLVWSQRTRTAAERDEPTGLAESACLLEYWARSRLGATADETGAQHALAALRRRGPAPEARAFSLYAQALFWQAPRHAITQLDSALDLNARCSLHLWQARLLHLKSLSLDAAGQLAEAERFLHLARETAQRQRARLFLDPITGIESPTFAAPHREFAT
jgi:hypothetical protein